MQIRKRQNVYSLIIPTTPSGQSSVIEVTLRDLSKVLWTYAEGDSRDDGGITLRQCCPVVGVVQVHGPGMSVLVVRGGHTNNGSPFVSKIELSNVCHRRRDGGFCVNRNVEMVGTI